MTQTWRGRPLVDRIGVVELIAVTGLKLGARSMPRPTKNGSSERCRDGGVRRSKGDPFHPEWNYTIRPKSVASRSG
ncbi:hypothetical protein [Mesorhizobium sp. M0142]|uniref:hypothetical protein n=1 Tax=Mesorhizobium sp. M0142 TaxID=2956894 RepID=UPI00333B3161